MTALEEAEMMMRTLGKRFARREEAMRTAAPNRFEKHSLSVYGTAAHCWYRAGIHMRNARAMRACGEEFAVQGNVDLAMTYRTLAKARGLFQNIKAHQLSAAGDPTIVTFTMGAA